MEAMTLENDRHSKGWDQEGPRPASMSRVRVWTGRVMSTLVTLFLLMDAVIKFVKPEAALKSCAELGLPESSLFGLGVVLLASVVLYVIPRTAVVGAVVLTGYLGGAIAAHVRVGHPWLSHTLFPIYVAVFIWGGLYLRDPRVRALLAPLGRSA